MVNKDYHKSVFAIDWQKQTDLNTNETSKKKTVSKLGT